MVTVPESRPEIWSGAMRMARRKPHFAGNWVEDPKPRPETCLRQFCFELAVWAKVRVPVPEIPPPRPAARPWNDGSGVWWEIRDDADKSMGPKAKGTGAAIWWIEAADWRCALGEKRRLCRAYGWKPSWARIYPALGPGERVVVG